ncbi:hypothetical protein [Sandaracinus amylolyticus]|uniref:hypothetical protein n=1 Tax=Sandaracinus amylolyticus TaxID=927083 RepID=UPI001F300553|nr:hypothetical protein [Sandaracinus amylolyticus]
MSTYEEAILAAMERRATLEELVAITVRHREDHGLAREDALRVLEAARAHARDERSEDTVLELMDRVSGWCPPGHDLF